MSKQVDLRGFLDLEAALTKAVYPKWKAAARDCAVECARAFDRGDDAGVNRALEALRPAMQAAFDKASDKVYVLAAAMVQFGTFVSSGSHEGVFSKRGSLPDAVLDGGVGALEAMMVTSAVNAATKAARAVMEAETRARNGSLPVFSVKSDYSGLVGALSDAVLDGGRIVSDIASNLTTSRLVNYGAIAELYASGVLRYKLQAILDNRTSKFCQHINGRTFDVAVAFPFLDQVVRMTDPTEIAAAMPFYSSKQAVIDELLHLTDAQLQARGYMVPPFHPHCRTVVVKLEARDTSVETEEALGPSDLGAVDAAAQEDDRTPVTATTPEPLIDVASVAETSAFNAVVRAVASSSTPEDALAQAAASTAQDAARAADHTAQAVGASAADAGVQAVVDDADHIAGLVKAAIDGAGYTVDVDALAQKVGDAVVSATGASGAAASAIRAALTASIRSALGQD